MIFQQPWAYTILSMNNFQLTLDSPYENMDMSFPMSHVGFSAGMFCCWKFGLRMFLVNGTKHRNPDEKHWRLSLGTRTIYHTTIWSGHCLSRQTSLLLVEAVTQQACCLTQQEERVQICSLSP